MVVRAIKWFFPDYFWIRQVLLKKVKNGKILDASLFYLSIFWFMKKLNDKNMAFVKYWLIPQRAVRPSTSLSLSLFMSLQHISLILPHFFLFDYLTHVIDTAHFFLSCDIRRTGC